MKTRKLLSLMLAVIMVLSLAFSMCACTDDVKDPTDGATEEPTGNASESGAPSLGEAELFFNPDRLLYDGLADDAMTARPKNLDDGYFHVEFATDGKIVEHLAKKRMVANLIDTNWVMALQLDEKNIVTGIYTLDEMGGKVAVNNLYVTATTDTTLTINTNNTLTGDEITHNLAADVKIYDVSDKENNYGAATTLIETDEIYAIANANDEITHIWVMSRASQRNGRGGCICGVNEGTNHKEGCDGSLLYMWQPWTNPETMPASSGYWYLDVPNKTMKLEDFVRLKERADIFIDLNGHTITTNGPIYMFQEASVATNLTILDSAGGAKFNVMREPNEGNLQATFFVHYGKKHIFTMYGGTVDASKIKGAGGNGGVIRSIGGTVNIYGGKIIGSKDSSNTGNCIWSSGIVNIKDCEITGGHAKKGGNIFMQLDSSYSEVVMGVDTALNVYSGKITNGTASVAGGNIFYMEGVKINIADGVVSGGDAPENSEIHMQKKPTAAD